MERARQALCITVMLGFCLAWPVVSQADPPIPEEPGDERLVTQFYDTIAGLLIREYSLQGNGRVDYRTARQILWIAYDDPAAEELDVTPYPILYWHDADQNGQWELWVDRDGEGQLGDVVRYDGSQPLLGPPSFYRMGRGIAQHERNPCLPHSTISIPTLRWERT